MAGPKPEELAKEFARRWLRDVSAAMRDMGEKELARIIKEAIEADRKHRGRRDAADRSAKQCRWKLLCVSDAALSLMRLPST